MVSYRATCFPTVSRTYLPTMTWLPGVIGRTFLLSKELVHAPKIRIGEVTSKTIRQAGVVISWKPACVKDSWVIHNCAAKGEIIQERICKDWISTGDIVQFDAECMSFWPEVEKNKNVLHYPGRSYLITASFDLWLNDSCGPRKKHMKVESVLASAGVDVNQLNTKASVYSQLKIQKLSWIY